MEEFKKVIKSLDPETYRTIVGRIMYELVISRATFFRRLATPGSFTENDWRLISEVLNTYASPTTGITYSITDFYENETRLFGPDGATLPHPVRPDSGLRIGIGMDNHEEKPDGFGKTSGQPDERDAEVENATH